MDRKLFDLSWEFDVWEICRRDRDSDCFMTSQTVDSTQLTDFPPDLDWAIVF